MGETLTQPKEHPNWAQPTLTVPEMKRGCLSRSTSVAYTDVVLCIHARMQGEKESCLDAHQPQKLAGRRLLESQTSNHYPLLEGGEVAAGEVYDSTNGFQQETGCATPNSLDHAHSTLLLSTCNG